MQSAGNIIGRFVDYIIDPLILIVFSAGFFLFLWGLVNFLWNIDEGGENTAGKQHMIWGIVGMVIMVSVYGIISMIDNTLQLNIANPDVSRINNVQPGGNFFGN